MNDFYNENNVKLETHYLTLKSLRISKHRNIKTFIIIILKILNAGIQLHNLNIRMKCL